MLEGLIGGVTLRLVDGAQFGNENKKGSLTTALIQYKNRYFS